MNANVARVIGSLPLLTALAAAVTAHAADNPPAWGSAFRPQVAPAPAPAPAAAEATTLPGAVVEPRSSADGAPAGLRVMVLGRERPLAAINGQIVHVGDRINGMRVVQISREGVLLQGEGPSSQRMQITPSVVKLNRPSTEPAPGAGARP